MKKAIFLVIGAVLFVGNIIVSEHIWSSYGSGGGVRAIIILISFWEVANFLLQLYLKIDQKNISKK